jgi:plastocyanin
VPATARHMNAENDFVFRADLFFGNGNGAMPKAVIQNYSFIPNTIHVQPGETITIYNDDQLMHNIVAGDGSFASPILTKGGTFTIKAGDAGTVINFRCTLHSRMHGQIVVDSPPQ